MATVLRQLKDPVPLKSQSTLAERALPQGDDLSKFATELEEGDTLSEIFLQPPLAKHLHLIVQRPFGKWPHNLPSPRLF